MQADTPVSKIMTRRPLTIAPETTMERARLLFEKHGFHHIPVLEDGKLLGIVSYSDYLRIIRETFDNPIDVRQNVQILNAMLARDVMTAAPYTLKETDTLELALQLFQQHQFHSLPVIDENNRLAGIVTTVDLMKVLEKIVNPQLEFNEEESGGLF